MRRSVLVLSAILIACGPAHAIKRVNVTTLSCQQAKDLVAKEGAVIFRYPSKRNASLILFDRFVAHSGFCSIKERAKPKTVPSASGSCRLRICKRDTLTPFGGRNNQQLNFGIN
jgi:hypothetical protein